ncbi:hypothetical protein [Myceligenerans pegani]|uniref:Uncharacterized protein n=1 Tax=Myceligenerans pegani TaxID=2776917 RepID=A0ABR9MXZ4_9MICO|nr:hypothetical protein [Myceligenerans sp. TRM 65318]MBE1876257.1 hypothetical protein [Myceligenerans sp. TRM 65318]MBE3018528.1 hypothetical protein [Myceligenerans sp. TRM 65318]
MSDLHVLAPVTRDEPRSRRGRSAVLAVALVLVVAAVVWLFVTLLQGSRAEARSEAALGRSAHAAGDCDAADRHLKSALDSGSVSFLDSPVDRSGLRAEIAACEELERARHLAGREEYRRAIAGYGDYLASGAARYGGALDERSEARMALGRDLEARDEERRAVRQYAAVMADAPESDLAETARERVWALYERDVERGRKKEPCRALDPARAWARLKGEALEPVRAAAHEALSWSLLRCGEERIARAEAAARDARYEPDVFGAARYALTRAVEDYPGTKPGRLAGQRLDALPGVAARAKSLAAEVARERLRTATIRKQVAAALRDGDGLTRPRRTGDAGDSLHLTVRNATGRQLYVAWTGRETDSVTIPAGGKTCAGARTITITLPPGDYSFAVREKGGWSAGSWSFPSKSFRTCVR